MIDVDSLKDHFVNIGKILASGSNCSNLEQTIIPKSIDKTFFLYPTDGYEFYKLIRTCETTNSSGFDGLSKSLDEIAGPLISDF